MTTETEDLIHDLSDIGEKPESIAKELGLPIDLIIDVLNGEIDLVDI